MHTHTCTHTHMRSHSHNTPLQRGNDCSTGYEATHYTIALGVIKNHLATLQGLWPTSGNISHSEQMWRLRGEIPSGQEGVELVVKVAAASGNEGVDYTQLVTMATFKNAEGFHSQFNLVSNVFVILHHHSAIHRHRLFADNNWLGVCMYVCTSVSQTAGASCHSRNPQPTW